jgi:hypothetical protein
MKTLKDTITERLNSIDTVIFEKLQISRHKNHPEQTNKFEDLAISFIDININPESPVVGTLEYDNKLIGMWFNLLEHIEVLIKPDINVQTHAETYAYSRDKYGDQLIDKLLKRFIDEIDSVEEIDVTNDPKLYDIWVDSTNVLPQKEFNLIKSEFEEFKKSI